MHYDTAVFDLDGTLLDTLDDLTGSTNYALAQHGLPARTRDEVRQFVGNGILNLIRLAVPTGSPPQLVDAVHATFDGHDVVMGGIGGVATLPQYRRSGEYTGSLTLYIACRISSRRRSAASGGRSNRTSSNSNGPLCRCPTTAPQIAPSTHR